MSQKLDKVSKKLEADEYTVVDDLWKPKGMHWRTFSRQKMAEIDADDSWGERTTGEVWVLAVNLSQGDLDLIIVVT
jgi:hypothetical protein